MAKRIGIITAGGDSPGLNAAIRGVGKAALSSDIEVLGFRDGFRGLAENLKLKLDKRALSGILTVGGTILGTGRDKPHRMEVDGQMVDVTDTIVRNYEKEKLDALVCLGGGGTHKNALRLVEAGLNIITLPKTIDNDVALTDATIGFDTALGIATEAIDRLHSTAHSHHRIIIAEVMGHRAGWLTLGAGIAGGADVILIPEIPFSMETVAEKIRSRDLAGSNFSIIVVAEGALEIGHDLIYQDLGSEMRAPRLGGIGQHLQRDLEDVTGRETRCVVLGHLQRGGRPNAFDRMLATNFGSCAVRALANGEHGVMVALQAGDVVSVPLTEAIKNIKTVPPNGQLVRTARDTGISFGASDEANYHKPL